MFRRRLRAISLTVVGALAATGFMVAHPQTASAKPTYKVTTVASGLTIPWDVTWIGSLMIFDERGGGLSSQRGTAAPKPIRVSLPAAYNSGEGGRLGLVADPAASANQRFYLCQTYQRNSSPVDVRVLRLKLNSDTTASLDGSESVVVDNLPISSGRHSGCRLRFGPDGKLYVGTGDAAQSANSQNKQSLGGKVLRVNSDGSIPTDNPFYSSGGDARYVWTYGHRNVQGIAVRPGTKDMWTAEHGTDRDDEINLIRRGANYGWQPGPGYDESPAMTDKTHFSDAISAKWRSRYPTVATSGLSFLAGSGWGHWQGAVATGMLKGKGIKVLFLNPKGSVTSTTNITGLGAYGRIRSVQSGPGGALYFTTSNGGGKDVIAKITPTAKPPVRSSGTNVDTYAVSAARTGNQLYAYIRSTDSQVLYKRSADDGASWPASWSRAGVTSASAPAVASSAPGRIDLITRDSSNSITHTWYVNGVKLGSASLGGPMRTATVSSLGDGTLDVLGLRVTGGSYRQHFDGHNWTGWRKLAPGGFTSAIGASADPSTGKTLLTARTKSGQIRQLTVSATSPNSTWTATSGSLWSGRALGDRQAGQPLIAASKGSDGYLRLERDSLIIALPVKITSAPDVVTRPDGSWIVFGRSTKGTLHTYDSRTVSAESLGGSVR